MEPVTTRFEIDKFDGKGNFALWKFKLLGQLELLGLRSVLEERNDKPENSGKSEEDAKVKVDPKAVEKDNRVKVLICASLGDDVLLTVMDEPTSLDIWKALERDYQVKSLPNRIRLKRMFTNFKMSSDKCMSDNLSDFHKLLSEMKNLKVPVTEEDKSFQLLCSLPEQYDQIASILKYGNGKETLTVSEVTSAIYTREVELREKGMISKPKNQSEGLFVSYKGKADKKYSSTWKNKEKKYDKPKFKPKTGKPNKCCFICGKEGHWKANCPQNRDRSNPQDGAHMARGCDEPMVLTVSVQDTKQEWIMDSGCTFHITPVRENLHDFEELDGGKVYMGNNTCSEVKGIGKLKILNPDDSVVILTGVRYMPTMSRNLISYGQLEKSGCQYEGGGFMVKFFKNGKPVISGKYQNGLYYLQGKVVTGETALATEHQNSAKTWHSRLGHMSIKCMKMLVKKNLLKQQEVSELGFCEECVLGKSQKQSFKKAKHTSKAVLDYIHSDIWGSQGMEASLSGCKYFITFIDDYSRKVWIYFLHTKDEAFGKFIEWKSLVETQSGRKIKCLRTDNGLEFCNKLFDQECSRSGIKRHKTCAYTPQQNGVAERMNKTIMNKVRCMLVESGLEKKFWAEAASTAVYLINLSPTSALEFRIPEELWTENEVSLKHIKRFGCIAYVHVNQDKISPRAVKGYFVGYPQGVKGYRIWVPEEGRCVVSRNVVFQESVLYKDETAEGMRQKKDKMMQTETTIKGNSLNKDGEVLTPENTEDLDSDTEKEDLETSGTDNNGQMLLDNYLLARDRERRTHKLPKRFEDNNFVAYALSCAEDLELEEPKTVREAKKSKDWKHWKAAMNEEMDSLTKNNTWEIVPKPRNQKTVGCKWIYKWKEGIPGVEEPRFKARLVAKGFTQVEGVDYNEIFSPVVKHVSIRIILSLVANFDYELEQMDVKTAFLHGNLDEIIYMDQPEEFVMPQKEECVCLLKKSLYGLKQSPRQWNQRFDHFMKSEEFKRSSYDACVYMKGSQVSDMIYLLLYVDDMLIASKNEKEITKLKDSLKKRFEMKDLGPAKKILGMEIIRDRSKNSLKLTQERYLERVLRTFNMSDAKPVTTPVNSQLKLKSLTQEEQVTETGLMNDIPYASAVGSLMYAMIGTRPDLAFAVCLVSRFMATPGKTHWESVKWILRYLRGMTKVGLMFQRHEEGIKITGFCDSDYASDLDKRRSVTGYVFKVGGNVVSWRSKLQHVVALSTTEAEYMALSESTKEGLWLRGFVSELGFMQDQFTLSSDSQSAICLAKNSIHHDRTKHISVKIHFIRDILSEGTMQIKKVHTTENPADVFTKGLPGNTFEKCLTLLNMLS